MRPVDIPWPEAEATGWRWAGAFRYCPVLREHDGTCHVQQMPVHLMWSGLVDGELQVAMYPGDGSTVPEVVTACGEELANSFEVTAAAESDAEICGRCWELMTAGEVAS